MQQKKEKQKRRCQMGPITVVAVIVGVLAGLGGAFALGIAYLKRVAETEIGSA